MKISKKVSDLVIAFILVYLITLLVFSSVISWKTMHNEISISRQDIISYAMQYLTNEKLVREGSVMDCSSYTSAVYKKFGIHLPRSSKDQFNNYLNQHEELFAADLVFFKDDYNNVSHVGLILSDSTFIHSPGRNKPVRIDNLNKDYWEKSFAGSGCVLE